MTTLVKNNAFGLSKIVVYLSFAVILFYLWSSFSLHPYLHSLQQSIKNSQEEGILSDQANEMTKSWLELQVTQKPSYPRVKSISNNVKNFDAFHPDSGINIWDLFPPLVSCPDMQRIGKVGEGGKWVCGLSYLATKQHCIMYSFGISTDITFEMEILRNTNCIIYAFDPTVGKLPTSLPASWANRIIFHKAALGTMSGSSEQHSLVMQLYDIMHSYGHAYIDMLKIDIERGEWTVFDQLLYYGKAHGNQTKTTNRKEMKTMPKVLPVGQMLIELHYSDYRTIATFFHGLLRQHFFPFSREINLLPTLQGGLPFAAEYSFLNVEHFYHMVEEGATPEITPETMQYETMTSLGSVLSTVPSNASLRSQPVDPVDKEKITSTNRFAVPRAFTPAFHRPISAVLYFLTKQSNRARMCIALQSVYVTFLQYHPHYPVVIFHDDYTTQDEAYLLQHCLSNISSSAKSLVMQQLKFLPISFAIPKVLLQQGIVIPNRTVCDPQHSTLGYRHMCRFHAYQVHDLLDTFWRSSQPHSKPLEYIWRLDDDSFFAHPIGYDPFRYLRINDKKYGFVSLVPDNVFCVTGLWESAHTFLNNFLQHGKGLLGREEFEKLIEGRSLFHRWNDPMVFYNNFEISHVSLWQHPLWQAYRKYIESSGGIYTLRWGDAPIHTIGVSMVLEKEDLHAFTDLSYRHQPFINQVARGLPMPYMDPFHSDDIICEYYESWQCRYHDWLANSSTNSSTANPPSRSASTNGSWFLSGSQVLRDESPVEVLQALNARIHKHSLLPGNHNNISHTRSVNISAVSTLAAHGKESAVLFTFAMARREDLLIATLTSFYQAYLRSFPTPVVVFYAAHTPFQVSVIQNHFQDIADLQLTFLPITFQSSNGTQQTYHPQQKAKHGAVYSVFTLANHSLDQLDKYCINPDPDSYAISMFLRTEAFRVLRRLGFDWFIRFADDASFLGPLSESLISHVLPKNGSSEDTSQPKKKYAYLHAMQGRQECSRSLWAFGEKFCASLTPPLVPPSQQSNSSLITYPQCSPLFKQWNEGLYLLASLEISHSSVWESYLCSALFASLASQPESVNWGDAALHTLCILVSLRPDEIVRLDDRVAYEVRWSNAKMQGTMQDQRMQLQAYEEVNGSVAELSQALSMQRLGWLGGDVATSIPFPPSPHFTRAHSQSPNQVLWLFGDSIIGAASQTKRLNQEYGVVANTVGMMQLGSEEFRPDRSSTTTQCEARPRSVKRMKYYWREEVRSRAVQPIFEIPESQHSNVCGDKGINSSNFSGEGGKAALWLLSGITLSATNSYSNGNNHNSQNDSNNQHKGSSVVKLILLGSLTCSNINNNSSSTSRTKNRWECLDFVEREAVVVVVHNPSDAPDLWHYDYGLFPQSFPSFFRFISIVQADGALYGTDADYFYLLVSFTPDMSIASSATSQASSYQTLLRARGSDLLIFAWSAFEVLLQSPSAHWVPLTTFHSHRNHASTPQQQPQPYKLFGPAIAEGSLYRHPVTHTWHVVSLTFLERYLQLCTLQHNSSRNHHSGSGDGLAGSHHTWHCEFVYALPDHLLHPTIVHYAAKAHPHLLHYTPACSGGDSNDRNGGEMVFSYLTNTVSMSLLFDPHYRHIYLPSFVHLRHTTSTNA